jgi:DNA primase
LFLHIQRMIVVKTVRNPYATQLQLPSSVFKQRRTNALYLKFIEVITIYNQFRKRANSDEAIAKSEKDYLETTIEDIEWANKLLKHVLLKKSDDLSGASRGFLERLKKYLEEKKEDSFKAKELRMAMRISSSTLNRHLIELASAGYLRIAGGNKAYGFCYEINNPKEYKELKNSVQNELSETLDKLRKPKGIPL